MLVFNRLSELRSWRNKLKKKGQTLAFVPTMGNLHQGHIELVKQAQLRADVVITSIFVNPMQFGENEDLDAYPRTFDADCAKLEEVSNHAVFYPTVADMYPNGLQEQSFVEVPETTDTLCGEATQRPGHFRGVSTVVTKLFNMVQPDIACFGEKDYQQLRVIRRMVADLNMPIEIVGVPTVREESGLAKSSRNGYLSDAEKVIAPNLFKVIKELKADVLVTEGDVSQLEAKAATHIDEAGLKTDYIIVRDAHTLAPVTKDTLDYVILAAAYLGKARLIDNLTFSRHR